MEPAAPHPSDVVRSVGQRLRNVRRSKALTLAQVAQKTGYSATAIGGWERGTRTPSIVVLAHLADVYDVTVADLLPDGQEDAEPVTLSDLIRSIRDLRNFLEAAAGKGGAE